MRPFRIATAILLAAAGCHGDSDLPEDIHGIVIGNRGAERAAVDIIHFVVGEEGPDDFVVVEEVEDGFSVAPGETVLRTFPAGVHVKVSITRESDGLPLYDDVFSPPDFFQDGGTIEIAVSP